MLRSSFIKRWWVTAAVVALVPLGGAAAAASPAQAAPADDNNAQITCQGGAVSVNMSPGLMFLNRKLTITGGGNLGKCSSYTYPQYTGATFTIAGFANGACPDGYAAPIAATVTWNNGDTSELQGILTTTARQFSITQAAITSGAFKGLSATIVGEATKIPWWDCVLPWGISHIGGQITFAEARGD